MSAEGMVSVIVPTYNRAQLCMQAVESALNQTYTNIEVIVIDDGSTDDTEKVISRLHEKIVYIRQKNAGVVAARNRALQCARGEFVAFLDSDDIWFPWKLECQVSVLNSDKKIGMIWSNMSAVSNDGKLLFDRYLERMYSAYRYFDRRSSFTTVRSLADLWQECPQDLRLVKCFSGDIYKWMFLGNLVHTSTVLMRRERQLLVGNFSNEYKRAGEDYDFHFKTCLFGEVAYIDIPSIYYRIGNPDQITVPTNMIWYARSNAQTIEKAYREHRDKIQLPQSLISRRFAESYAWLGAEEISVNRIVSRNHSLASLRYNPFQIKAMMFALLSYLPQLVVNSMLKSARAMLKLRRSILRKLKFSK